MENQTVTLTGVDIPFRDLVVLFTKIGLALIPALLVLWIVFTLVGMVFAMLVMPSFVEGWR